MTQYVALLRGINVGGTNIIKMTELKACFEEMGFAGVLYWGTQRPWLVKLP